MPEGATIPFEASILGTEGDIPGFEGVIPESQIKSLADESSRLCPLVSNEVLQSFLDLGYLNYSIISEPNLSGISISEVIFPAIHQFRMDYEALGFEPESLAIVDYSDPNQSHELVNDFEAKLLFTFLSLDGDFEIESLPPLGDRGLIIRAIHYRLDLFDLCPETKMSIKSGPGVPFTESTIEGIRKLGLDLNLPGGNNEELLEILRYAGNMPLLSDRLLKIVKPEERIVYFSLEEKQIDACTTEEEKEFEKVAEIDLSDNDENEEENLEEEKVLPATLLTKALPPELEKKEHKIQLRKFRRRLKTLQQEKSKEMVALLNPGKVNEFVQLDENFKALSSGMENEISGKQALLQKNIAAIEILKKTSRENLETKFLADLEIEKVNLQKEISDFNAKLKALQTRFVNESRILDDTPGKKKKQLKKLENEIKTDREELEKSFLGPFPNFGEKFKARTALLQSAFDSEKSRLETRLTVAESETVNNVREQIGLLERSLRKEMRERNSGQRNILRETLELKKAVEEQDGELAEQLEDLDEKYGELQRDMREDFRERVTGKVQEKRFRRIKSVFEIPEGQKDKAIIKNNFRRNLRRTVEGEFSFFRQILLKDQNYKYFNERSKSSINAFFLRTLQIRHWMMGHYEGRIDGDFQSVSLDSIILLMIEEDENTKKHLAYAGQSWFALNIFSLLGNIHQKIEKELEQNKQDENVRLEDMLDKRDDGARRMLSQNFKEEMENYPEEVRAQLVRRRRLYLSVKNVVQTIFRGIKKLLRLIADFFRKLFSIVRNLVRALFKEIREGIKMFVHGMKFLFGRRVVATTGPALDLPLVTDYDFDCDAIFLSPTGATKEQVRQHMDKCYYYAKSLGFSLKVIGFIIKWLDNIIGLVTGFTWIKLAFRIGIFFKNLIKKLIFRKLAAAPVNRFKMQFA